MCVIKSCSSLGRFLTQLYPPPPLLLHFLPHSDKFGDPRYLFQGQCRDVCPEGFFHSKRKLCEPCSENCAICVAADRCLHCGPGHKLRNGQCIPLECSTGERKQKRKTLFVNPPVERLNAPSWTFGPRFLEEKIKACKNKPSVSYLC